MATQPTIASSSKDTSTMRPPGSRPQPVSYPTPPATPAVSAPVSSRQTSAKSGDTEPPLAEDDGAEARAEAEAKEKEINERIARRRRQWLDDGNEEDPQDEWLDVHIMKRNHLWVLFTANFEEPPGFLEKLCDHVAALYKRKPAGVIIQYRQETIMMERCQEPAYTVEIRVRPSEIHFEKNKDVLLSLQEFLGRELKIKPYRGVVQFRPLYGKFCGWSGSLMTAHRHRERYAEYLKREYERTTGETLGRRRNPTPIPDSTALALWKKMGAGWDRVSKACQFVRHWGKGGGGGQQENEDAEAQQGKDDVEAAPRDAPEDAPQDSQEAKGSGTQGDVRGGSHEFVF